MAIEIKTNISYYDTIPSVIFYLKKLRDGFYEDINEDTILGINITLVFQAACLIEGSLESGLNQIINKQRFKKKFHDPIIDRLFVDISDRLHRTTGISNYNNIFKLLFDKNINDMIENPSLWESINILFQFRNIIAHGRAISMSTKLLDIDSSDLEEHAFKDILNDELRFGSFGNIQEYLLKNNLITNRFSSAFLEQELINNDIADHFWGNALIFLYKLSNNIPRGYRKVFKDGAGYNFIKIWSNTFKLIH